LKGLIKKKKKKNRTYGSFETKTVSQPSVIPQYNGGMGGTDLGDQKDSYYVFLHRTEKWTHRLFTSFLMTTATNAHILYNTINQTNISLLDFLFLLMEELAPEQMKDYDADSDGDSDDESDSSSDRGIRRRSTLSRDQSRFEEGHSAQTCPGERRICMYSNCQQRGLVKCMECDVFLCIDGPKAVNCFWLYHHEKS